ncbi:MAG: glycosyltransferase involved in cell wall biosynthesis [Candidatus Aldehydirespiratoraceae bacterium]
MTGLRVGLDVTSLLGPPAGIHQVTRGLMQALSVRDDVDLSGWILSARGKRPDIGLPIHRCLVPAAFAQRTWGRSGFPGPRLTAGDVDVIHGTNFLAPPGPSSVITLQDLTPITHPEWCEPSVAAMAPAIRSAVRRGTQIHVSSELVAHEAQTVLGIPGERVHVVHHAITPVVGGSADEGRALAGADRYVLALGTVEQRKNIQATLSALPHLADDVRIVVAGAEGNNEPAVTTARHDNRERIVRLTHFSNEERASLLRGATVLAFPSAYEGFGLPPLEALSIGTPVVATAVGALPELVGHDIDLVQPDDSADFIERLAAAVEQPTPPALALQERLTRHTWPVVAEEMMPVYDAAAGAT